MCIRDRLLSRKFPRNGRDVTVQIQFRLYQTHIIPPQLKLLAVHLPPVPPRPVHLHAACLVRPDHSEALRQLVV